MKQLPLILSILALAGVIALAIVNFTKGGSKNAEPDATEANAHAGDIVYFNMDRVLQEYDMANDLSSVFQTKANSISEEVNRRQNKLQRDANSFQDKVN